MLLSESEVSSREAVRRLAEVLYQETRRLSEVGVGWCDLPSERKIDLYDTVLILSDFDCYWRTLFDTPDDDPVSGSAIDSE